MKPNGEKNTVFDRQSGAKPDLSFPRVRSSLLSQFPNVVFGMSARQGGDDSSPFGFNLGLDTGDDETRVQRNLLRFLAAMDLAPNEIAFMNQVHGATITDVTDPGIYLSTDAMVSQTSRLGLAIQTADCVPMVLYAPGDNLIAAIHAGWRGSAEHITSRTIQYLAENCQCNPTGIFAYLGPSAGVCCYEVSHEIASLFPSSVVHMRDNQNPKLDLRSANVFQLIESGVPKENIEADTMCTICNPCLFHSYRRDGNTSGRMLAVISMKEIL